MLTEATVQNLVAFVQLLCLSQQQNKLLADLGAKQQAVVFYFNSITNRIITWHFETIC